MTETHGTDNDAPDDAARDHAAMHLDVHAVISDYDHGHAEPRLGPIDWAAWGYALVGVAAGLVVVAFFWLAVG